MTRPSCVVPRGSSGPATRNPPAGGGPLRSGRQQRPKGLPDVGGHERVAFRRGVDAVGLVQSRLARDAVEQEGHESRVARPSELRVDRAKASPVVLSVVRQRFHGHEHELRRRLLSAGLVEDRLDVLPRGNGVLAPQTVVRPRLDDEHRHGLPEEPAQAAPRAGRCLAAHSRVDHAVAQAGRVDLPLDEGGVRLLRVEPEAGGETGPDEEDDRPIVGGRGHGRGRAREGRRCRPIAATAPPEGEAAQHGEDRAVCR
jgi:hypothetical protein